MAKMPKYEKIRNRLLRGKPAPKPNRIWVLINSGFVLWLLSALFLTLGGRLFHEPRTMHA